MTRVEDKEGNIF